MKRFFVSNNELLNKTILVYGCNEVARKFSVYLASFDIEVSFFIGEKETAKYKLLGKEIIDIEKISSLFPENKFRILVPEELKKEAKDRLKEYQLLEHQVLNYKVINPEIAESNNIVIYGTGEAGLECYRYLMQRGIEITCFADSDIKKAGNKIQGIEIVSPQQLYLLSEPAILIASMYYKEIEASLFELKLYNTFIGMECYLQKELDEKNLFLSDGQTYICMRENSIRTFVEAKSKYNLYILLNDELYIQFLEKLRLFDVKVCGIVTNNENLLQLDETRKIIAYYDFNYIEDHNKMLICVKKDGISEGKLIKEVRQYLDLDYKFYASAESGLWANPEWATEWRIDRMIGYSCRVNDEYPGFSVWDNTLPGSKAKHYNIVLLGGSTTYEFSMKSNAWIRYLYKELKEKSISFTLYGGGTPAYTIQEELRKLIRDVLNLEPDIVISYSGVNNMTEYEMRKGYPFYTDETCGAHSLISLENRTYGQAVKGIKNKKDSYSIWRDGMKMMKVICDTFSISFIGVKQPMLESKLDKTFDEEILLMDNSTDYRRRMGLEYREAPIDSEYMYDFSDIFDGEPDVYFDQCHTTDKGSLL